MGVFAVIALAGFVRAEEQADRELERDRAAALRSPGGLTMVGSVLLDPLDRQRLAPLLRAIAFGGNRECLQENAVLPALSKARRLATGDHLFGAASQIQRFLERAAQNPVTARALRSFFAEWEVLSNVRMPLGQIAYGEYLRAIDDCRNASLPDLSLIDPASGTVLLSTG